MFPRSKRFWLETTYVLFQFPWCYGPLDQFDSVGSMNDGRTDIISEKTSLALDEWRDCFYFFESISLIDHNLINVIFDSIKNQNSPKCYEHETLQLCFFMFTIIRPRGLFLNISAKKNNVWTPPHSCSVATALSQLGKLILRQIFLSP